MFDSRTQLVRKPRPLKMATKRGMPVP